MTLYIVTSRLSKDKDKDKDKDAVDFKSSLCTLMFLFRNPSVWLAFLVMLSM